MKAYHHEISGYKVKKKILKEKNTSQVQKKPPKNPKKQNWN